MKVNSKSPCRKERDKGGTPAEPPSQSAYGSRVSGTLGFFSPFWDLIPLESLCFELSL